MKQILKLLFSLFVVMVFISGCSVFRPCPCKFSQLENENTLYEVGKFEMAQVVPDKE